MDCIKRFGYEAVAKLKNRQGKSPNSKKTESEKK
jgi:hypothetical protein